MFFLFFVLQWSIRHGQSVMVMVMVMVMVIRMVSQSWSSSSGAIVPCIAFNVRI
jgi:hypothetical protein